MVAQWKTWLIVPVLCSGVQVITCHNSAGNYPCGTGDPAIIVTMVTLAPK
jgi:hypothetical protein